METNGQLLNALSSQSMTTEMIRVFVGISVAFSIASVLAVSVVQRTREIGILRAMGSPRGQILRVFLLQGGLLGLLGSACGGLVGWGLVQVFNLFGPRLFIIPVDPRWCRWPCWWRRSPACWRRRCPRDVRRVTTRRWRSAMCERAPMALPRKSCARNRCARPSTSAHPWRPKCCTASTCSFGAASWPRWSAVRLRQEHSAEPDRPAGYAQLRRAVCTRPGDTRQRRRSAHAAAQSGDRLRVSVPSPDLGVQRAGERC